MSMFLFNIIIAVLTFFGAIIPFPGSFDYDTLPIRFEIESVSDVYVPANNSANVAEYPTVIRLCHQKNEADNGKLLATFEKLGDTYPIYESTDDAKTWRYICTVRDTLNENYWNEWMPFLYELPADIGEFEKGTIILAATSIYGEGVTNSTITLYSSTDLGRSFTAFCNVDKAGGID